MTFRRFAPALTPVTRSAAVLALLAVAGVAIASANTEAVIANHFTAALDGTDESATARLTSKAPVAGTEAYWLAAKRRHDAGGDETALEPVVWSAPVVAGLTAGDHIAVPVGTKERVLEVIAIADVETAPGAAEAASTARQIAVTCRDLGTPDGRLVTFIVPANGALASGKTVRIL